MVSLFSQCKGAIITCWLAIQEIVLRNGEFHPNVVLLLNRIIQQFQITELDIQEKALEQKILILRREEQTLGLNILIFTCCLNGNPKRVDKNCIQRLQIMLGRPQNLIQAQKYIDFICGNWKEQEQSKYTNIPE